MASKLNPNVLYVQEPRESLSSLETDHLAHPEPGEESSDSDGEPDETEQKLIRKVSTSGQLRAKKSVKEGILLKQTSSFQRWKRRFFKLRGRTLYYAKDSKSLIFDEVDLSDASVAETSTKNINNSFTVNHSFRKLDAIVPESRKCQSLTRVARVARCFPPATLVVGWLPGLSGHCVKKVKSCFGGRTALDLCLFRAYGIDARPTFCQRLREAALRESTVSTDCPVKVHTAHPLPTPLP
ncbi:diacylglycerol kinase eta-like [Salvelinus sp. IW2-2015]|uniref:diacylglycerol kinase eta-like n=1 Tax=Salvelinus sp. IW2-2015 TaxID=2691554 RepID=UPI0038D3653F